MSDITNVISKARAAQEAHDARIPVQLSLDGRTNDAFDTSGCIVSRPEDFPLTIPSRDATTTDATHEVAPGHPVKLPNGNGPRR